jgi:hypothetical protein
MLPKEQLWIANVAPLSSGDTWIQMKKGGRIPAALLRLNKFTLRPQVFNRVCKQWERRLW